MSKQNRWNKLLAPIQSELEQVENALPEAMQTGVPLLAEAGLSLFQAGGKRLRPAFLLLAGKMLQDDIAHLLPMAVAVEMAHAATLIHDDLIDHSPLRRNQPTVHERYGNRMAVYTGNYLFNQSLIMVNKHQVGDLIPLLVKAAQEICQGEIDQLQEAYQIPRGLKTYLSRIKRKTALLIALSCEIGARMCEASEENTKSLYQYGYYLGMAFQISDDVLDFMGDPSVLGKPVGSDVAGGLITLPLIYALQYSPQSATLAELVTDQDLSQQYTADIVRLTVESGGIRYAQRIAERYAQKAVRYLTPFPPSASRQSLKTAAEQISRRSY